jgi:hypothetical protein
MIHTVASGILFFAYCEYILLMPFDCGEIINKISDAILRAPAAETIARSPIYTGLLIAFVIVLIVMFVFRDADTEESLLVMCLRTGFWTSLFLICILFLHNKILTKETTVARSQIYDGAFSDRMLTPQSAPQPSTLSTQSATQSSPVYPAYVVLGNPSPM